MLRPQLTTECALWLVRPMRVCVPDGPELSVPESAQLRTDLSTVLTRIIRSAVSGPITFSHPGDNRGRMRTVALLII